MSKVSTLWNYNSNFTAEITVSLIKTEFDQFIHLVNLYLDLQKMINFVTFFIKTWNIKNTKDILAN